MLYCVFAGSAGSISQAACTSALVTATTQVTSHYATRRPLPERELVIVRTPNTTAVYVLCMCTCVSRGRSAEPTVPKVDKARRARRKAQEQLDRIEERKRNAEKALRRLKEERLHRIRSAPKKCANAACDVDARIRVAWP